MDIKITGKRLKNVLYYDLLLACITIVGIIVVVSLLFTTTATRATDGQQFYLVVYEDVKSTDGNTNYKLLNDLKKDKYLSFDVLDVNVNAITAAGNYSAAYMLSLRLSTNEGDVILIGGGKQASEIYALSEEERKQADLNSTEIQVLINGNNIQSLDSYLNAAKEYTVDSGFITETEDGYVVNKEVIEKNFRENRARATRNYRNTYRSEESKAEGVQLEIERIENTYKYYKGVSDAIEKAKAEGNDFLWYGKRMFTLEDGSLNESEMLPYAIDLSKLNLNHTEDKKHMIDSWYLVDEEDNVTDSGLLLSVFNIASDQPDLHYESLGFLYYIIRNYSSYAD